MYISKKLVKVFLLPGIFFNLISITSVAQEKPQPGLKINGVVTEAATGKALPGISVSAVGFSAALTDSTGHFKLSVPNKRVILNFSGQGYHARQVALKSRETLKVELYDESLQSLSDVATTSYSNKPLLQTTQAVTTIQTNGSWNKAPETPDAYLQGRVAGLNATRRSGTPGIGADLLLRGYNSLYATSQPLIVVDGMIYDVSQYGSSLIGGHVTNHFANIDLKDIDNITVIKDGASMYGTRGANGVILITTGRAKDVATRFDFAAYGGFNNKVSEIPVMNAGTYRSYLSELLRTNPAYTTQSIQAQPYMNDNTSNPDYYRYHQNTDWQDKVMQNGYVQNYYLKVTGGDNIATYALSLGYLNNDGLTANTLLKRYETRFNANLNLSQKLKAQANLAFTRSEQQLRDQGLSFDTNPLYLAQVKAPFLSPFEISDAGVASPNVADADIFSISNPYAAATKIQELNRNYRFTGSISFVYEFNKKWTLQTLLGVNFDKVRENTFIPQEGIVPLNLPSAVALNRTAADVQRLFGVYNDTRLSFNYAVNPSHQFSANVGFRYNNNKTESDYGQGYNTASDKFVTLGGSNALLRVVGGDLGQWNWLNTYANVDYKAYDKYFLSLNLAVDGSSRFGKDIPSTLSINGNKFAVMPSVAAAWLISSEPFMAQNGFIETLKLRLSAGRVGNDDIGNYSARKYYVTQSLLSRQGLVLGNIGNSALQWEDNTKLNAGLDVSVLKDRLSFSFDVYQNNISKMLIYEPVYTSTGFSTALSNSGSMTNRGAEFAINARIINTRKIKWDAGFNISRYKTKMTALPSGDIVTDYAGATFLTTKGGSANAFYGYQTNGVYTSDAEATASGLLNKVSGGALVPFKGGDVRFVDRNGDKVVDERDRTVIGNPNPDFTGAFNSRLTVKRISLEALFAFSKGNSIYNGVRQELESMSGFQNQTPAVANRWQSAGQVTNMPRAVWGDPAANSRFSDRWIEDGSYLRLRTVSLSYDVPVKNTFLRSLTVYGIANNVFTFTKYLGYDPEFSASPSPFARGVDTGLEPQFRSLLFGVRVGL
ncbi:TonB-linked SusC/RagA family outer membrane protein [Mucilaginibacter yixingensis]|uniref:TonB-linked SusC/RagA family outer membrane protein n=1 Tax=Mucilaginibacter yixingensis TaxID=1295612 RepID=A0A2T5JGA4_9SPHI|nr:SusC/RagA family TonB-linked outer membrane protein [Mucilaginibacter yixingensis]PTR01435.1 TonB-linked SusC/RagA family outer membrane protein [Mucilaginibacter yixingensis]